MVALSETARPVERERRADPEDIDASPQHLTRAGTLGIVVNALRNHRAREVPASRRMMPVVTRWRPAWMPSTARHFRARDGRVVCHALPAGQVAPTAARRNLGSCIGSPPSGAGELACACLEAYHRPQPLVDRSRRGIGNRAEGVP